MAGQKDASLNPKFTQRFGYICLATVICHTFYFDVDRYVDLRVNGPRGLCCMQALIIMVTLQTKHVTKHSCDVRSEMLKAQIYY